MSHESDRTIEPSRRRLAEARREGVVARSRLLTASTGLTMALGWLTMAGPELSEICQQLVADPMRSDLGLVERIRLASDAPEVWVTPVVSIGWEILGVLGPGFAFIALSCIVVHQFQVRGLLLPGLAIPKPRRLIGARGGSGNRFVESFWNLGVLVVLALTGIGAWVVLARSLLGRWWSGADDLAVGLGGGALLVLGVSALGGLVVGAFDLVRQQRRLRACLRMTPQEHRDELRSEQGDPSIRRRRSEPLNGGHAEGSEADPDR